jgi:type IV protein arginine methyltransferase
MDQLIFDICGFAKSPVDEQDYLENLKNCLKSGVPPTITTSDVELAKSLPEGVEVSAGEVGTSPLHMICASVDPSDNNQLQIASKMVDILFEFGGNWSLLDDANETAGCIARRRGLTSIYEQFVRAGVRSEVFLRRMTVSDNTNDDNEADGSTNLADISNGSVGDTAVDQQAYLSSKLEYTDETLVTQNANDGVMMKWEEPIMKKSCELITDVVPNDPKGLVILNVGFGLGIIDSFIQDQKPYKHYISEAHPDVLEKLQRDGWDKKPNVIILQGRWQDTLPKLIDEGVVFDGIYYDTFSEHYDDLVSFFDITCGLLAPEGVFSFFNGLGADRQISYDVYSHVVEVDLKEYGLKVQYIKLPVGPGDEEQWRGIRQKYWNLHEFLLPKVSFDF